MGVRFISHGLFYVLRACLGSGGIAPGLGGLKVYRSALLGSIAAHNLARSLGPCGRWEFLDATNMN